MKTVSQIKEHLAVFSRREEDGSLDGSCIEEVLFDMLEVLDYQEKVISGIQNVERQKWEAGRLHLLNNPPRNPGDGQP